MAEMTSMEHLFYNLLIEFYSGRASVREATAKVVNFVESADLKDLSDLDTFVFYLEQALSKYKEQLNKKITKSLIELESVGALFCPESGYVYPANLDDSPDFKQGSHITETENDDWYGELSAHDVKLIINNLVERK